jgi:hypothetical protein
VTKKTDSKGNRFGCKTATLDMIGYHFFSAGSNKLKNQHVVEKVDKMACACGFANQNMKGDV